MLLTNYGLQKSKKISRPLRATFFYNIVFVIINRMKTKKCFIFIPLFCSLFLLACHPTNSFDVDNANANSYLNYEVAETPYNYSGGYTLNYQIKVKVRNGYKTSGDLKLRFAVNVRYTYRMPLGNLTSTGYVSDYQNITIGNSKTFYTKTCSVFLPHSLYDIVSYSLDWYVSSVSGKLCPQ